MKKQQGFTLIELVIVIVILGILAVTAAPKFLDLSGDAKKGTIQAVSGAMKSASDAIRAKALIGGFKDTASATLTLDNNDTAVTTDDTTVAIAYGYPAHDWTSAWTELLEGSFSVTTSTTVSCASDFCVDTSHSLVSVTSDDDGNDLSGLTDANAAVVIYANGSNLAGVENCYAYYLYDDSGASGAPAIGTVTDGCD